MKKFLLAIVLSSSSMPAFSIETNRNIKIQDQQKRIERAENLYEKQDYKQAFAEFQKEAKNENPNALFYLGIMFENGQGVNKSDKKAVENLKKSASKGFAPANFELGKAYLSGTHGLEINQPVAKKYLKVASNNGMEISTVGLAEILLSEGKKESTKEALDLLSPLIKKGQLDATYLRALYDLKTGKESNNIEQVNIGIKALESNAMHAHIESLMVLGNFYATGTFVPKDLTKAKEIFTVLDKAQIPNAKKLLDAVNDEILENK